MQMVGGCQEAERASYISPLNAAKRGYPITFGHLGFSNLTARWTETKLLASFSLRFRTHTAFCAICVPVDVMFLRAPLIVTESTCGECTSPPSRSTTEPP